MAKAKKLRMAKTEKILRTAKVRILITAKKRNKQIPSRTDKDILIVQAAL